MPEFTTYQTTGVYDGRSFAWLSDSSHRAVKETASPCPTESQHSPANAPEQSRPQPTLLVFLCLVARFSFPLSFALPRRLDADSEANQASFSELWWGQAQSLPSQTSPGLWQPSNLFVRVVQGLRCVSEPMNDWRKLG
jgi:hypothetical protein